MAKLPDQYLTKAVKNPIKMNYEELELQVRPESNRLELIVGNYTALIEYKLLHNNLLLLHTEVPEELEGKGVGSAIVLKTLQYAKEKHYRIVPLCPFVQAYLKRHSEWNEIVSEDAGRYLDN